MLILIDVDRALIALGQRRLSVSEMHTLILTFGTDDMIEAIMETGASTTTETCIRVVTQKTLKRNRHNIIPLD